MQNASDLFPRLFPVGPRPKKDPGNEQVFRKHVPICLRHLGQVVLSTTTRGYRQLHKGDVPKGMFPRALGNFHAHIAPKEAQQYFHEANDIQIIFQERRYRRTIRRLKMNQHVSHIAELWCGSWIRGGVTTGSGLGAFFSVTGLGPKIGIPGPSPRPSGREFFSGRDQNRRDSGTLTGTRPALYGKEWVEEVLRHL